MTSFDVETDFKPIIVIIIIIIIIIIKVQSCKIAQQFFIILHLKTLEKLLVKRCSFTFAA